MLDFITASLLALTSGNTLAPGYKDSCSKASVGNLLDTTLNAGALLHSAAVQLGGVVKLQGIDGLQVEVAGKVTNGLQSYDPARIDTPDIARNFKRHWSLDFKHRRHRLENWLEFDGATLNFVNIYTDGRDSTFSPNRNIVLNSEGDEQSFISPLARYTPALLVARALENASTASAVGRMCVKDAATDMVDFNWAPTTRLRLYISSADHRVVRVDALAKDPINGDDLAIYEFKGEQVAGGIGFPQRVIYSRRGTVFTDLNITAVRVNPSFADGAFETPAGLSEVLAPSGAFQVADGVYQMAVGNGPDNYAQYFDLGDSVALFDAPLSDEVSRSIADQIKQTLNKPVRYVILSHFHEDHIRGVGYFVDQGASIILAPENIPVVQRYLDSQSRFSKSVRKPRAPKFVPVDGKFLELAGTGKERLQIYNLTNLPHVKSMLIAFHPTSGTLATADIHNEFAPDDRNAQIFASWLDLPTSPKASWILDGHHRLESVTSFRSQARSAQAGGSDKGQSAEPILMRVPIARNRRAGER